MRDFLQRAKQTNSQIVIGELIYNPETQTLHKQAVVIDLEPRSIELLELLLTSVGHPLSAETIIETIWQSKFISKNVLTNRISTLRALLQEHLPEHDAAKLLVTYPRKGYFFNPANIQLIPPARADKRKAKVANPQKTTSSLKWPIAYCLCALLTASCVILSVIVWQQQGVSTQQTRNQLLIPKVELLLNRVDALGAKAREYRTMVKAILLQQQVEYPYTDIANQDAPSYFLDPINETPYFPGARNMQTSDYQLNIELKDGPTEGVLKAKMNLIYPATGKLAFRNQYMLRTAHLQSDLFKLHTDIAQYFNLPEPSKSTWHLSDAHKKMLLGKAFSTTDIKNMDEFAAITIARHLALYEQNKAELEGFLYQVQSGFDALPDELNLWMGILHYKLGNLDKAKTFLTTPAGDSLIQNALIYTFVSHIAYKQNKLDQFRLNYMESLVALLRVMPSEELFSRLSQPESKETCLQPWKKLRVSIKEKEIVMRWKALIEEYCTNIEADINPDKTKT
ncbi:winged helix-turn-helix domain-containing protein [Vibrio jasicida]|uniref:winged helix-turn-helix domain-containing protein n=1 Tax=Vibrio jasicida TaxID=766224 RepID=UPI000CE2E46E|nr:winged helix-turn-helix domain-containing protein [Vibrio jasicida]